MNIMNNDKTSAEQLYKRYQETRDDIPLSTFDAISTATESAQHEQAIHAIAQAAKVASANRTDVQAGKKSSWFTTAVGTLRSYFSENRLSKPIGLGFACLAVFAAVGPLFLNSTSNPYFSQEVAHLSDCAECQTHIRNALATTRGASPALSTLNQQARLDAKLGLIQGRLQVESAYGDQYAISNAAAALNKLDKTRLSSSLIDSIIDADNANSSITAESLSIAIGSSANSSIISDASNAIFVANISARNAQDDQNIDAASASLLSALKAMQQLPTPTLLQEAAISKLENTVNAQTTNLRKVIKDLEFAARSLGV
jgi:hypothetical protein